MLVSSVRKSLVPSALALAAALGLASCSGAETSTAKNAPVVKTVPEPAVAGSPALLRLITSQQYVNTLVHTFGKDFKIETQFPPHRRTDGLLAVGAATAGFPAGQIEQYQRAAATVAARVVDAGHRDFLIPCKPVDDKKADAACAAKFLAATGRMLYRRPMDQKLLDEAVLKAGETGDRLKDFYAGVGVALEGMLIAPEVLFISDTSEPDPNNPGQSRLDAYSLASRLSLFLWNASPDDMLLKAAESGEIQTPKGRARIVETMLASPRLETGMRAFFDDMFGFDRFDNLAKDPNVYPAFTGVTVQDAREQTLRTAYNFLVTKGHDYRDLYTTRETFLSPALAALYQLPTPPYWVPYEFPADSPRAGLLTHISFLAVHSHPGRSSPTVRGKALRELLLCQPVPRPPANVDFSAVENPDPRLRTARDRLNFHSENPVCAGCHKITDPMGLALENFDGAGRYRKTEGGAAIDASGRLDGKEFTDVIGLGVALHDHPGLSSCLVRRMFSYATGANVRDQTTLGYLNESFTAEGYRIPDLLRTIALSNAFSRVAEPYTPPGKTAAAAPATEVSR
ncbi:MAG: DUF1588 domain-containing protein [Rhodospirillaceae bacterium]|nr:DUF1588 domain-containing protein [Rhodospirillaceae bacterium]